jgi:hypothetical protein
VTFESIRALKGRAPGRAFRFVLWKNWEAGRGANALAGTRGPTHDVRGDRRVLVGFEDLHDSTRAPAKTQLGAAQRVVRWATSESSSPYSAARFGNWTVGYERQVREETGRQKPQALARGSDRVVLARTPARTFGGAHEWTVERTIKGSASRKVPVRTVVPSDDDFGPRALLFLRKVGDVYEPSRLGAGIVPVRGNRVPSWNCSLDEAIARVTR